MAAKIARTTGRTLLCIVGAALLVVVMWVVLAQDMVTSWEGVRFAVAGLIGLATLVPLASIVGVFVEASPRHPVVGGLLGGVLAVPLMAVALFLTAFSVYVFAIASSSSEELHSDGFVRLYETERCFLHCSDDPTLSVRVGPIPVLRSTDMRLSGRPTVEENGSWLRVETPTECLAVHRLTGASQPC